VIKRISTFYRKYFYFTLTTLTTLTTNLQPIEIMNKIKHAIFA